MRVLSLDDLPVPAPSVVTIGKFDGLHLGHQALIDTAIELAAARGSDPVVLTFDRNPREVFQPGSSQRPLTSLPQKLALLESAGVGATLVARFDEAFAALSPAQFVRDVLVDGLHAVAVVVGPDFRFGAHGVGDTDTLRELGRVHGFEVVVPEVVADASGRRVSSGTIRQALEAGDVRAAARMLGRPLVLRGEVVHGQERGRALGFPTANLSPDMEGFIPADGVYAGWLTVDGVRYPAAASIGNNPTFDGVPAQQVEAYALDQDFDIYGRIVELELVEFIRGMLKFTDVTALIEQMTDDVAQVRRILEPARR